MRRCALQHRRYPGAEQASGPHGPPQPPPRSLLLLFPARRSTSGLPRFGASRRSGVGWPSHPIDRRLPPNPRRRPPLTWESMSPCPGRARKVPLGRGATATAGEAGGCTAPGVTRRRRSGCGTSEWVAVPSKRRRRSCPSSPAGHPQRVHGGGCADPRIRIGDQCGLDRDRPVVPGSRDRGTELRIPRSGEDRARLAVGLFQASDADPRLDVHQLTDEVPARVTDRRVRMPGDPATRLRGDPVPATVYGGVAAALRQQRLDHTSANRPRRGGRPCRSAGWTARRTRTSSGAPGFRPSPESVGWPRDVIRATWCANCRTDQRSPAKRSFSGRAAPVVSRTRTKVSTPMNSPNLSLPILRKKMLSP